MDLKTCNAVLGSRACTHTPISVFMHWVETFSPSFRISSIVCTFTDDSSIAWVRSRHDITRSLRLKSWVVEGHPSSQATYTNRLSRGPCGSLEDKNFTVGSKQNSVYGEPSTKLTSNARSTPSCEFTREVATRLENVIASGLTPASIYRRARYQRKRPEHPSTFVRNANRQNSAVSYWKSQRPN